MSDIPVSKRKESRLQAQHEAYKVRKTMTEELMRNFGLTQKRLKEYIEKRTAYIQDEAERTQEQAALRMRIEDFVRKERERVTDLSTGITGHLRAANTIFPEFWDEYMERRLELDRAMEYCNRLQDELQYIAEAIPADKNKYTGIVLQIDKVFNFIKKLRQSDRRLLPNLKCVPAEVLADYYASQKKESRKGKGKPSETPPKGDG